MGIKYNPSDLLMPGKPGKSEKAGRSWLILWTILAVIAVGCASYWLTRPLEERKHLRQEAANAIDGMLRDTPLAGLGATIAESPPPPPPEVLNPPTEAGTLAGRQVTGTIAAPMDFGPLMPRETVVPDAEEKTLREEIREKALDLASTLGMSEPKQSVVFDQEYVPKVTEDNTVTPGYLAGLAQWLVNHYRGGDIHASVQALNQEAGGRLARSVQGGRTGLLRYVLQPTMINGLYNMYIDRFMEDLKAAALKKGFTEAQNQQFYSALEGRAALLASALEGVLQIPDLPQRMAYIDQLAQKTVDENADLTTSTFELDEARQNQASARTVQTAEMRVAGSSARYRRAAEEYERAQARLSEDIRKYAGPGMDSESLLFLASWVGRRESGNAEARAALKAGIGTLRDLARRCSQAGGTP